MILVCFSTFLGWAYGDEGTWTPPQQLSQLFFPASFTQFIFSGAETGWMKNYNRKNRNIWNNQPVKKSIPLFENKKFSYRILIHSHAGGVRYCILWRMVSVETI